MLINSLGSLKVELGRYMFHQRFQPDYDTAIQNFEQSANRRLRVRPMEAVTTLTTVNGEATLPLDYSLWRVVFYTPRSEELDYVHPAYFKTRGANRRLFTIEGDKFKTVDVDDTADVYEFHYFQKIPTINGNDNNSNWLLLANSDVYLYGVLVELFTLGRNLEGATLWKQRRDEVLQEIIQSYALTTAPSSSAVREAEYF